MTSNTVTLTMIVAADEKETIGQEGKLPWHLPEDLKRFRRLTHGHVVVAGRFTHESIVARLGRPLPDRLTVVVTRSAGLRDTESVHYRQGVDAAIAHAREIAAARRQDQVFIIGGSQIYAQALPLVTRVQLTRVQGTFPGDCGLPAGWLEPFGEALERVERQDGEVAFAFETYERR